MPYGASIIAFGLGYLIFVIVAMYVVWREYYCLWPGLRHSCNRIAVRRMAWPGLIHLCYHMAVASRVHLGLPLASVTAPLPSYGFTSYGASIAAFGLG